MFRSRSQYSTENNKQNFEKKIGFFSTFFGGGSGLNQVEKNIKMSKNDFFQLFHPILRVN